MSIIDTETTTTEARVIVDTAYAAAKPTEVTAGLHVLIGPDGRLHQIDAEEHDEKHALHPQRKRGSYAVHDADSFGEYMAKHAETASEVWADVTRSRVVGVVNAHAATDNEFGVPGWEDHTVTYAVQHTDAWKAWIKHDGKLLSQAEFAEHIEDRSIDVVEPAAADMLELAQTFQATLGVDFQSSQTLSSGERQLMYRETVDAKAGKTGRLEIPQSFKVALRPFEGASTYGVTARLRYRIADGQLRLGYRLERPEDVLRNAFDDVVAAIRGAVSVPVFNGAGRS